MTTIDSRSLSEHRLTTTRHSATCVADVDLFMRTPNALGADFQRWTRFIDDLVEWMRDPGVFDDEGFVPPTQIAMHAAIQCAVRFRDRGEVAPLRVIPDGEGGIVFEHRSGDEFVSLEFAPDQWMEAIRFVDCRVVHRERCPFPAFARL